MTFALGGGEAFGALVLEGVEKADSGPVCGGARELFDKDSKSCWVS
jgi:hypothetical protein